MAVPYMRIVEKTDVKLHLKRSPPFRSWLVFAAIVCLGFYAGVESGNCWLGIFYFLCGVGLGHVAMDRWEECIFDLDRKQVTMFHRALIEVILQRPPGRRVVSSLSEVTNVRVESETLRYAGTTFSVALTFDSGFSLALTSTGTYGNKSVQEELVKEIKHFLGFTDESVDVFDKSAGRKEEEDDKEDDGNEEVNEGDEGEHEIKKDEGVRHRH